MRYEMQGSYNPADPDSVPIGAPAARTVVQNVGQDPPGKRFCGDCGAALTRCAAATVRYAATITASGEQQHLTICSVTWLAQNRNRRSAQTPKNGVR